MDVCAFECVRVRVCVRVRMRMHVCVPVCVRVCVCENVSIIHFEGALYFAKRAHIVC